MLIASDKLEPILDLYHQGFMLRAYAEAQKLGPVRQWEGAAARVVAGRLAMNLGSPQLARVLHRLAHRDDPADAQAKYYCALAIFERRGPLATWEFLREHGDLADAPPRIRADWLSLHARVLSWFRDFPSAHQWQARAEELAPERPWIYVERAELLQREDRYPDALAAANRALELHPWYRPALQCTAELMQLLDRDQDALSMLRQAAEKIESAPAVVQLAALESELGLHDDARKRWERVVELSPMVEKPMEKWLYARRSDAAYYCGDYAQAAEFAEKSDNPFHKDVGPRLRDYQADNKPRRTLLSVGFVRQHHMTCAPATLSALSRYWSKPAEHLNVVEDICYDGTPAHSERAWAEKSGYVAREFTVTWDSTLALIDRGVPFTFTTVEPASAHLQAVIGYDVPRKTLLIRDPYMRHFGEFLADATFERYKPTGPRGMVFAPQAKADELLAGIELPEAELYDAFYEVQQALQSHDRDKARAASAHMDEIAPKHRLTFWARRALASYDANPVDSLSAVNGLLELYPDDVNLKLAKVSILRVLARREERLALLKEASEAKGSDPLLWLEYAQELKDDAREHAQAERLLRRTLRYRRTEARALAGLADIRWSQRRMKEAVELYRFAACIQDRDEGLARTYFVASRHLKETPAAMQMLRERIKRFGRKSGHAARSFFWACEELNRNEDGFTALDEALGLCPADADLLLYAASAHARHGKFEKVDELLAKAKGKTSPMAWMRVAAEIAQIRGESLQALELWRNIADAEPLAADGHRMLALLLAETQSPAAALEHLKQIADRFPHNYRLLQLLIEWMRSEEGPVAVEAQLRRLIAVHPADGWSRRELVGALLAQNRIDEALAEAQTSMHLEPTNPSSPVYLGLVLVRQGKIDEARQCYRDAVALSVDADFAISHLVGVSDSIAQKKEALTFVQQELVKQTIFGDGLLAYRAHARDVLEPAELLAKLREALEARPDLWHAWTAVSDQLAEMGELTQAEKVAMDATERFPLLPRTWVDLANVRRALNQPEKEIAALKKALEITPGWGQPVRDLAGVYERQGELDRSKALLEQAIKRSPLDAYHHGCLADVQWKLGDREGALERVRRAVKLEPGYPWAWDALSHWAGEMNRPELAADTARELTVRRAGEARSWLVLGRILRGPEQLDERLAALDKAIELNARSLEGYDLRARIFAEAGRFDEALSACRAPIWGAHLPSRLLARAAWIEAQRGNLDVAIKQMQQVVADDPNLYWAWNCLADWYRQKNANADYLRVASILHSHWPNDPVSMGFFGEARLRNNDRAGARKILREVVSRYPDYEFGLAILFGMEMEDGSEPDVRALLAQLDRQSPGAWTLSRHVRYAVKFQGTDQAAAALRTLAEYPTKEREPIDQSVTKMADARMRNAVVTVLTAVLHKDSISPMIGGLLVEQLCNLSRWTEARGVVEDNLPRGEIGQEAAQSFLYHAGNKQQSAQLKRLFVACGLVMRKSDWLWGWGGYALQTVRHYKDCITWLSDWRERKEAQSWMLVNLAEAYRALGRDEEAREVHQYAGRLNSSPEPRSIHSLWLAFDSAIQGVDSDITVLKARIDRHALRPGHLFLHDLFDALLAAKENRSAKSIHALLNRATAAHPPFRKDRELRRAYRRCLKKLIATHGNPFTKIGYLARWIGS